MKRIGLSVGDTITLSNGNSENSYRVVGSFKSRATDVEAVIPSDYAVSDFGAKAYGFLAYTAAVSYTHLGFVCFLIGKKECVYRNIQKSDKLIAHLPMRSLNIPLPFVPLL